MKFGSLYFDALWDIYKSSLATWRALEALRYSTLQKLYGTTQGLFLCTPSSPPVFDRLLQAIQTGAGDGVGIRLVQLYIHIDLCMHIATS